MSEITELIRLCNIDLKIRRIENEVDSADDGSQLKDEINSVEKDLKKFETALAQITKKLNDIKGKIESSASEKKKMESRIYSDDVNSKQIDNIQLHLKKLNSHIDDLETGELELMEKIDKYGSYKDKLQKKFDDLMKDYGGRVDRFKELKSKSNAKTAELSKERASQLSRIDEEQLELYDKIKKRKSGIAMAEVVNMLCTGCNQIISSSLDQKLAEVPDDIYYCNNCGRIVYRVKVER